ncbi:MAG: hypothetical protein ACTSWR_05315 [Candidatus Helarchaeota archaeon]
MIEILLIGVIIVGIIFYLYFRLINFLPKDVRLARSKYYSRRKESELLYITKNQKILLINNIIPSKFIGAKRIYDTFYFKNAIISVNDSNSKNVILNNDLVCVYIIGPNPEITKIIRRKIESELVNCDLEDFFSSELFDFEN